MSSLPPGQLERLIDEYAGGSRWQELGVVLDGLDRRQLSPPEQQQWFQARGVVDLKSGKHARALETFAEGVSLFPTSGRLNFGLGQEYERGGRIAEMATCFQRVQLADVGSRTILAIARYYYLWDRNDAGQRAIQLIFNAYYELKIADDMFLYMRGLPMFGEAFGYRATFARLAGRSDDARAELARAQAVLKETSFDSERRELEATASGDWSLVLADLETELAQPAGGSPRGDSTMKRAVLRSRRAASAEAGLADLDAVRLTANDHAWLEDIRTLARAELFARLAMPAEEAEALATFLSRQALLFEPNHAFHFGFIEYQERLKPRYQATRRSG